MRRCICFHISGNRAQLDKTASDTETKTGEAWSILGSWPDGDSVNFLKGAVRTTIKGWDGGVRPNVAETVVHIVNRWFVCF
jgi:hypothetical protein